MQNTISSEGLKNFIVPVLESKEGIMKGTNMISSTVAVKTPASFLVSKVINLLFLGNFLLLKEKRHERNRKKRDACKY